jgi:hypothetical protein
MPLAYALELGIVRLLVLAPLINTRALTLSELRNAWTILLPSPPPGPPPHGVARPQGPKNRTQPTDGRVLVPTVIPTEIKDIVDEPVPIGDAPPSVLGGLDLPWAATGKNPVIAGIFAGNNPPPSPPQTSKPSGAVRRIQVGGQVIAAKAIYQPTLLNGEPVEVLTEIAVNFTLAE